MFKKGIKDSPECPPCHNCVETSEHLIFECNISKFVWFSSPLGLFIPPNTVVLGWLDQWLSISDPYGIQLICYTMYSIWFGRNQVIFNACYFNPIMIVDEVVDKDTELP